MVQLTNAQQVFIVRKYHETRSFRSVQEAFREVFPDRNQPAKSTIQNNVQKYPHVQYQQHHTSLNVNKGRRRRRTVRIAENIERVRTLLGEQQQQQMPTKHAGND